MHLKDKKIHAATQPRGGLWRRMHGSWKFGKVLLLGEIFNVYYLEGEGGMDALRKRTAWWRSENVLDRRYHGHHCFDMNLGHMDVAVEQRIRLTAMVAVAAPPSLRHVMRCHEVGRGRLQLLAGTGASLDHRTHRLLSRLGRGERRIVGLRHATAITASRSNTTETRSTDTRCRYFEQQHRSLIPLHTAQARSPT